MASSTIMIHDGEDALLVDISLCLFGYRRALWLRESKTAVMALGYLELSPVGTLSYSHLPSTLTDGRLDDMDAVDGPSTTGAARACACC